MLRNEHFRICQPRQHLDSCLDMMGLRPVFIFGHDIAFSNTAVNNK